MKVMLAGQFVPEKIQGQLPVYGQPKLDGIRVYGEDGQAWTRSQKLVRSEWVQRIFAEAGPIMNGLDGEIIAGDPTAKDAYRRTNSSVMSYAKPDDVTLHVFDHWGHEGNFEERLSYLQSLSLPDFCKSFRPSCSTRWRRSPSMRLSFSPKGMKELSSVVLGDTTRKAEGHPLAES